MHLQVYKEPLCRRYYAAPCSCATIYYVGALVTLLLTPFFMAYDSNKFWAKTDTYLEQPEVTFTKQLLLLTEGLKGGEAFSASFATVAGMNHLNHARVRAAVVKSFASDTNSDGLVDRLVLNARLPLNSDEEVTSVKMLAFFRTRLRDRVRMEMDNLAYFEGGSTLAGEALRVEGNFRLRQTWPLSVYGGYTYPYVDDPLLDPGTLTSAHEVLFSTLLARQAARNITLDFEPQYALWERASSYHASAQEGGAAVGSPRIFNITAIARIHQQPILYIPAMSEVLQAGWSKYVVVLVIVLFLIDSLSGFVFRHQVVQTQVVAPHVSSASSTAMFAR